MWHVRAEIKGEFVEHEKFESREEAERQYDDWFMMGIWDDIQIWFERI